MWRLRRANLPVVMKALGAVLLIAFIIWDVRGSGVWLDLLWPFVLLPLAMTITWRRTGSMRLPTALLVGAAVGYAGWSLWILFADVEGASYWALMRYAAYGAAFLVALIVWWVLPRHQMTGAAATVGAWALIIGGVLGAVYFAWVFQWLYEAFLDDTLRPWPDPDGLLFGLNDYFDRLHPAEPDVIKIHGEQARVSIVISTLFYASALAFVFGVLALLWRRRGPGPRSGSAGGG